MTDSSREVPFRERDPLIPALDALLAEHAVAYVEHDDVAVCTCGRRFHDDTSDYIKREGIVSHAEHLASVVRERWAVIELPSGREEDDGVSFGGGDERGVFAYPPDGMVYDQFDGVTPAKAREIGSWWLAAADRAEAQ